MAGHDTVLARVVAVKLLRPECAQHPETLARFRAEARHAAGITHPGIAQVYDYMAPRLFELRRVLKPTGDKPVLDHPLAAEGQPGLVAAGGRAPRSHAFFAELPGGEAVGSPEAATRVLDGRNADCRVAHKQPR